MLVAEAYVGLNEIADGLNARPAWRRFAEQRPSLVHQLVGLAISAAQQKHQRVVRKLRHLVLPRHEIDRVGKSRIGNHAVGR